MQRVRRCKYHNLLFHSQMSLAFPRNAKPVVCGKEKTVRNSKLLQCSGVTDSTIPGSDSRSCSAIVQVRIVLKRTVVGDSD